MAKAIFLSGIWGQGKFTIVDDADYEFVSRYSWTLSGDGYVVGGPAKSLHRLLLQPLPGFVVDHINSNKRDNRRCNLQVITPTDNQRKRPANRKPETEIVAELNAVLVGKRQQTSAALLWTEQPPVVNLAQGEERVARERPRFYALLMSLGDSDPKRAAALGVQRMTVAKYRLGLATPRKLVHTDYSYPGTPAKQTDDPEILARRRELVAAWDEDERVMVAA